MNMANKKSIYYFLKKLNTITGYKELARELTINLLEICNAKACWLCLINFETGKVGMKRFQYAEDAIDDIELHTEAEKINTIATDFLTNNYDNEEVVEYFESISITDKIIEPVIYRNNLLGYIGLIGGSKDFNEEYRDVVGIIAENVNSRLEIISMNEENEKAMRERVEFLASISHEFKTPLNSIIGFSAVLKEKCKDKDNLKYIDNIAKSSKFLLSLIQDVLDLARSQANPMEIKYEYFRPKEVIKDIIWGFDEERKEKNIEFNYTLTDIIICADLRRFKQLIYNLISNAIKFNKINGKITIVTYLNEKQEFVFEIKDTGDGISKKDCAKIFNFFSQVNRNQLKRQQGSGVGLALCKTIARAHGGDLNFKSRLSYGSTFWFSIPQNPPAK